MPAGVIGWPSWAWIPLIVAAAFCLAVRNATQWRLAKRIGGVSATLVRFFFGLPFAVMWFGAALGMTGAAVPALTWRFTAFVVVAAALQVGGMAMLLAAMSRRGFTVAIVFSKTEVIQIALLSMIWLGEIPTPLASMAIVLATLGVVLLASPAGLPGVSEIFGSMLSALLLGLGSGAAFGGSNVFFRSALLELGEVSPLMAGAFAALVAQVAQTVLIGGYLLVLQPEPIYRMFRELPSSLLAGLFSTMASALGFMALTMRSATDVRAVGLVEVVFTYAISRQFFNENFGGREVIGIVLLAAGVLGICLS